MLGQKFVLVFALFVVFGRVYEKDIFVRFLPFKDKYASRNARAKKQIRWQSYDDVEQILLDEWIS